MASGANLEPVNDKSYLFINSELWRGSSVPKRCVITTGQGVSAWPILHSQFKVEKASHASRGHFVVQLSVGYSSL